MKKNFSIVPSVSISRSKFLRDSQRKTSIVLGEITPIFLDEVLPGDTRKIDMAALVRMNTPVAPIMDNIYIDYYAFYAPNRILWNHWKEFMGENNTSAGIYSGTEYVVPTVDISDDGDAVPAGSLGDHLGLPLNIPGNTAVNVSSLPGRMYFIVYNEWFRDQNIIAPIATSIGDTGNFGPGGSSYAEPLLKAAKTSDYFTRSLPYAQKGAPVTIPLGTSAPLKATDLSVAGARGMTSLGAKLYLGHEISGSPGAAYNVGTLSSGTNGVVSTGSQSGSDPINMTNLYADLSAATAATINQLRFAFQYQKMLEKDALYGTRLNAR